MMHRCTVAERSSEHPIQSIFISGNKPIEHREYTIKMQKTKERERGRDRERSIHLQLYGIKTHSQQIQHIVSKCPDRQEESAVFVAVG